MNHPSLPTRQALRADLLLIALTSVMKGGNVVALKAVFADIPPFMTIALRSALISLALVVYVRWRYRCWRAIVPERSQWKVLAGIIVLTAFNMVLFHVGLNLSEAGRATILVNLTPLFVAALSVFVLRDEPLRPMVFVGLAFGFLGVVLLFHDRLGAGGASSAEWLGEVLVLGAGMSWAVMILWQKRLVARVSPSQVVIWRSLGCALLMLPLIGLWESDVPLRCTARTVLLYGYLVLPGGAFVFALYLWVLGRNSASWVSAFAFLMPLTGVVLGAVLLGEAVTPAVVTAGVLVLLGISLVHRYVERVPSHARVAEEAAVAPEPVRLASFSQGK